MATTDNSAIQPLDVYDPICSSDSVWYKDNELYSVSDKLDDMDAVIAAKADSTHTHTDYASQSDLALLEDVIGTKANAVHTHSQYASSSHSHDDYATVIALDTLESELDSKADASHTHAEYAPTSHTHSEYAETNHAHSNYAETTHAHDNYASVSHTHTASEVGAAVSEHNHDEDYAVINHTHTDYATVTSLNELSATVSGKANASHSHDDVYYTETEIDTKLAAKADSTHNHDGVYDVSGAAASALTSANAYTDSKIDALVGEGASVTLDTIGEISSAIVDNQDAIDLLNAAIANKANATDLNSHANDTELHITTTERNNWNAKSDFSGSYNDLTNKPSIPSIDGLASEDYVDEKVGSVTVESIGALPNTTVIPTVPTNVSAFTNDAGYLTEHQSLDGLATETYVNTQIDAIDIPSALSDLTTDSTHRLVTDTEKAVWNAKSDFSGNYNDLTNKPSIPSITGLATETYVDEAVSSKADSGHNHNDVYYTETEVDSLLSAKSNSSHNHDSSYDALGTAETKANAVQANLDVVSEDLTEHIDNADIHFTTAERTKLSGIAANANNYTHPNSGVTAGTYKSVTVNAQGHITGGANPTTLAGYGITDAETKGAANSALTSAKAYTDELIADEVANRDSAIATAKSSVISTASSDATTKANNALASAKTYTDSAVATVKNDLLNGAGTAYDTLKELGDLIDDNTDAISALETVASGKANSVHTHAISDITNLQTTLNGKANTSHGTHVTYSTTAPVMDGTASVGTASTVARSDHKHPTDTSRAAQTDLDALETVVAGKANSSHTHTIANVTNLQSALDAKQSAITGGASTITSSNLTTNRALISNGSGKVAVSAVTSTELGYLDGVTSNVQTQLDGKAASSHTHNYAGSSSVGGAATSANKLNTNAGDANTPVYFANGVPVACTGLDLNTTGSSASCTGNSATATKLATARTINGTSFDGTSDINLARAYNYSLGQVGNNVSYCMFARTSSSNTSGNCGATLLVTDCGNFGGTLAGAWLVQLSNRGSKPTMNVTTLLANNNGTVTFGYYTTEDYFYFGVYCGTYASDRTITVLRNTSVTLQDFGDTTTAPNGWTAVTPRVLSVDGHTHSYAGSSSVGGAATSANKLNTNAGSATQPVYFANGVPVKTTYTLGASVPSGAKFTDTTYSVATTSANGLMGASDKSKLDGMVLATVSEVETYLGI